jgi:hypothetical protein
LTLLSISAFCCCHSDSAFCNFVCTTLNYPLVCSSSCLSLGIIAICCSVCWLSCYKFAMARLVQSKASCWCCRADWRVASPCRRTAVAVGGTSGSASGITSVMGLLGATTLGRSLMISFSISTFKSCRLVGNLGRPSSLAAAICMSVPPDSAKFGFAA